jgi:hypothetical protein
MLLPGSVVEQWIDSSYFNRQVSNLDMSRLDISQRGRCGGRRPQAAMDL